MDLVCLDHELVLLNTVIQTIVMQRTRNVIKIAENQSAYHLVVCGLIDT